MSGAEADPQAERAATRPAFRDRSRHRLRAGAVKAVPLAAALALAGAALLADRAVPSPMAGDVPRGPLVVPVGRAELDDSVTVAVKVLRTEGLQVAANRAGTLTSLAAQPGTRLADGDVVAGVNDTPVIAMTGAAPLYRDLGMGSRGKDVTRLEQFLAALGLFKAVPDESYDASTATAARAFQARYGLERGDTFRLDSVAWIGPGPGQVGRLLTRIGASVAPGAALLQLNGTPTEVQVSDQKVGQLSPGEKVLMVGAVRVPYRPGSGRITDTASVLALADALGSSSAAPSAPTSASPVPSASVPAASTPSPSPDSATGTGAGPVTEGAQDPDGPGGTAQIRPTTTVEAITVPSSAVVTDSSGTVCVFPAAEAAPVVVHPIGGGIGPVALPADTPITQVLANPADVLARPACG